MKEEILSKIENLTQTAINEFKKSTSEKELYEVKVEILGKKGKLTDILKDLRHLSHEDKPLIGSAANKAKQLIESEYQNLVSHVKNLEIQNRIESERIDVTLPGWSLQDSGRLHPLTLILDELKSIFKNLGFDMFEGPEVETEYYNFEALNIPADHPARDMQDTFYVEDGRLLRTHTSPIQIRVMENSKPPIQMVAVGPVYRCDSDVTHSPMFHQIEGLVVDKGIHLGHLKGVLEELLKKIFSDEIKVRLRPSFFPFTEPSAEVDISCVFCKQEGCRICSHTGWLEIMGCGMVDPAVFHSVNIDPEVYSGFAFGIGVERVAMLKYGISDIRLFYENDKRFLDQF